MCVGVLVAIARCWRFGCRFWFNWWWWWWKWCLVLSIEATDCLVLFFKVMLMYDEVLLNDVCLFVDGARLTWRDSSSVSICFWYPTLHNLFGFLFVTNGETHHIFKQTLNRYVSFSYQVFVCLLVTFIRDSIYMDLVTNLDLAIISGFDMVRFHYRCLYT